MTDCKEWWKKPGVNPNTSRKILIGGPTFMKLLEECGAPPNYLNNSQHPVKPEKPIQPVKPDKPEKPGKPVKPDKPEKPGKPVKPVKPAKPTKPDKPEKPVKPVKPAKPTKPDKHEKPKPASPNGKCKSWWEVPCVNPVTGKKLKMNGPVYNSILAECGPPRHINFSIESIGSSISSTRKP
jgi:hypothetical protein